MLQYDTEQSGRQLQMFPMNTLWPSSGQKYAKMQVFLLFSGPMVLIGLLNYHLLFHSLTLNKHISPLSFYPALIYNLP
jgi:hypothetical protein